MSKSVELCQIGLCEQRICFCCWGMFDQNGYALESRANSAWSQSSLVLNQCAASPKGKGPRQAIGGFSELLSDGCALVLMMIFRGHFSIASVARVSLN